MATYDLRVELLSRVAPEVAQGFGARSWVVAGALGCGCVTPRRSSTPAEMALKASVLALADRTQRVAAMLDRWEAEGADDEPDWDLCDIKSISLRPTSPGP